VSTEKYIIVKYFTLKQYKTKTIKHINYLSSLLLLCCRPAFKSFFIMLQILVIS